MTAKRILVVEDDSRLRRSIIDALRSQGFEVLGAQDGFEALDAWEAERPDVVLTDINMPDMDGIELVRELLGKVPDAKIIAMSGGGLFPSDLLLMDARLLGALEVLPKPFTLPQLMDRLRRVLGDSESDHVT